MAMLRKLQCEVSGIDSHGDGVYTIKLTPERPLPGFVSGQFLHLAIDPYDPSGFWPDSRAFSIASSPSDRETLEVVYSVVGKFTKRMEQELKLGSKVWVKLPYGDFVVDPAAAKRLVLIAGGTGVTAFISFVRAMAGGANHDVTLFYGARRSSLLLYSDEIAEIAAKNSALKAKLFAEKSDSAAHEALKIEEGRLSIDKIWETVAEPKAATYYLSGPPAMIQSMSDALKAKGAPAEQVKIDAWG
jgi:NAD(P)H-flavin reductase